MIKDVKNDITTLAEYLKAQPSPLTPDDVVEIYNYGIDSLLSAIISYLDNKVVLSKKEAQEILDELDDSIEEDGEIPYNAGIETAYEIILPHIFEDESKYFEEKDEEMGYVGKD